MQNHRSLYKTDTQKTVVNLCVLVINAFVFLYFR